MKQFLIEMTRAPEDGGGAPPAQGDPASAATPPPPAAGAEAAPPAAAPGQAPATPPAAAATDYWPEGLDATLRGADPKATLDNLAKVVKGYRDRDAAKDVPASVDAYFDFDTIKDFKPDDSTKPYFGMLKDDPAFKAMASVLHADGVSRATSAKALQAGFIAMAEAGLLEPLVDPVAEKALLVPDAAKSASPAEQEQAVQRRMTENADFLKLMETTRGLDPQVREYAELMMFDTANGHRFFEWMRAQVQGGAGTPPANIDGSGAGNSAASLRAEMARITRDDPQYLQKMAALEDRYRQVLGN